MRRDPHVSDAHATTAIRVHDGIDEVPRAAWDALVGDGSPFVEWDWLATLEESGAASSDAGWKPQHLTAWQGGRLVGACPLYLKTHSMGEFVFDQSWASAAMRAGIRYYPKLLVAVPFTPATGVRFLTAPDAERGAVIAALAGALEDACRDEGISSVHVNFCLADEVAALEARSWLRRTGYQYHWENDGYTSFDGWLESLRSKRRNQVRRERRALDEQGIAIDVLAGDAIDPGLMPLVHRLYRTTVDRMVWGHRYLDERFFTLAAERLRRHLCLVLARHDGRVVAGTFNVQKGDVFYGRYWGAFAEVRHLHFNVCYYAAIEHCIRAGLRRFEPGAGGEFKHLRGFEARPTDSMHLIADERLADAVRRYLRDERRAVRHEIAWHAERTAHRRDDA